MMRSIFLVHTAGKWRDCLACRFGDAGCGCHQRKQRSDLASSVLNEEDVALLRLFAMGKTDEIFIAIIQVENVVVAQIPRRDMQVRRWR